MSTLTAGIITYVSSAYLHSHCFSFRDRVQIKEFWYLVWCECASKKWTSQLFTTSSGKSNWAVLSISVWWLHISLSRLSYITYFSCYKLQRMAVYVVRTSCYVTLRITYNTRVLTPCRRSMSDADAQCHKTSMPGRASQLAYQSQYIYKMSRSGQISQHIYTEIQKAATVVQIAWHLTWSN